MVQLLKVGGITLHFFPSHSLFHPFLFHLSLSFPSLSSPFIPPLESRLLNPARDVGERCNLPQRGRSTSRNRIWCILRLTVWSLVATILMIFPKINWPNIHYGLSKRRHYFYNKIMFVWTRSLSNAVTFFERAYLASKHTKVTINTSLTSSVMTIWFPICRFL